MNTFTSATYDYVADYARDRVEYPRDGIRFSLPRLPFSTRKVGGLRFVKIGRLTVSYSISRAYKPL